MKRSFFSDNKDKRITLSADSSGFVCLDRRCDYFNLPYIIRRTLVWVPSPRARKVSLLKIASKNERICNADSVILPLWVVPERTHKFVSWTARLLSTSAQRYFESQFQTSSSDQLNHGLEQILRSSNECFTAGESLVAITKLVANQHWVAIENCNNKFVRVSFYKCQIANVARKQSTWKARIWSQNSVCVTVTVTVLHWNDSFSKSFEFDTRSSDRRREREIRKRNCLSGGLQLLAGDNEANSKRRKNLWSRGFKFCRSKWDSTWIALCKSYRVRITDCSRTRSRMKRVKDFETKHLEGSKRLTQSLMFQLEMFYSISQIFF